MMMKYLWIQHNIYKKYYLGILFYCINTITLKNIINSSMFIDNRLQLYVLWTSDIPLLEQYLGGRVASYRTVTIENFIELYFDRTRMGCNKQLTQCKIAVYLAISTMGCILEQLQSRHRQTRVWSVLLFCKGNNNRQVIRLFVKNETKMVVWPPIGKSRMPHISTKRIGCSNSFVSVIYSVIKNELSLSS